MKIIKQEQDYDTEIIVYETNDIAEVKEYIEKHRNYDLTIQTSKGEYDLMSDNEPYDILVENTTYHIAECHCDRLFINIKEVK